MTMTTDDRITNLESEVRTLKRLLLACGSVALLAIAIAGIAVSLHIVGAVSKDTPMMVEIVGFGMGTLPVSVDGSVDVGNDYGAMNVEIVGFGKKALSVDVDGSVDVGNDYGSFKVDNIGN